MITLSDLRSTSFFSLLYFSSRIHRQRVGGPLHAEKVPDAETSLLRGWRCKSKVLRFRPKVYFTENDEIKNVVKLFKGIRLKNTVVTKLWCLTDEISKIMLMVFYLNMKIQLSDTNFFSQNINVFVESKTTSFFSSSIFLVGLTGDYIKLHIIQYCVSGLRAFS